MNSQSIFLWRLQLISCFFSFTHTFIYFCFLISSDYEQGNIYLAESAQILIQNIVYEIPAMKKHSQKLEQVQSECDKKEANAKKRINELEQEFR